MKPSHLLFSANSQENPDLYVRLFSCFLFPILFYNFINHPNHKEVYEVSLYYLEKQSKHPRLSL
jgi:hypothetical protein